MSRPSRSALAGLLALALSTGAAEAQQIEDAYGWYLGGQGGVTIFETPAQTQASIPTVGGHVLVMVQKFGLLASYERAFEDGQLTSFADPTVLGGRRGVTFNAINKVTTAAVAYPFRGAVEPFIGGGLGIYGGVMRSLQRFMKQPLIQLAQPEKILLLAKQETGGSLHGAESRQAGQWVRHVSPVKPHSQHVVIQLHEVPHHQRFVLL